MKGIFGSILFLVLLLSTLSYGKVEKQSPATESDDNPPTSELIIHADKIFVPEILSIDTIKEYEKIFTFDWSNSATFADNKKRISMAEKFIISVQPQEIQKLTPADKEALGKIAYKLGTYYAHVNTNQDTAIRYLAFADKMLKTKKDKAWNYSQLAYAYEQKYANSENDADQEQSVSYLDKVLEIFPNSQTAQNKIIAYCHFVKACLNLVAKNYQGAEEEYQNALSIYEKLHDWNNGPYALAKSHLASILLEVKDENVQAAQMCKEVQQFWQKRGSLNDNPYAAKNLLLLGRAYLKLNKIKAAQSVIYQALLIYKNIYGEGSDQLEQPYQLMADSFKMLGDQKSADTYQIKANKVNKS